jgi:hypothetical protein
MTEDGEEVRNTWHISQLRRFYAWRTQDKIYVTIKQYVIRIHSQWNKDDIPRQHLSYYDNSWVVFTTEWEQKSWKRCLSLQSQVFSGLDESKVDKLTLEPILGCFHGLDESQRWSTDPEFFSQPDGSKRAEKMLELVIPNLFRLRWE